MGGRDEEQKERATEERGDALRNSKIRKRYRGSLG
jgi:hypothetical protein